MNSRAVFAFAIGALLTPQIGFAIPYHVDLSGMAAFGTLDQTLVGLNGAGGLNYYCAPTATMNSFTFLTNAYSGVYGNRLMGGLGNWELAGELLAGPDYMQTNPNGGTSEYNWINGKVNYIQNFAPGTTRFEGMDAVSTGGQAWVHKAAPTASFLLGMLQRGGDVEIGISPTTGGVGHVLTLSSIDWNDANDDLLFNAGDTLSIDGLDPAGNGTNATPFTFNLSTGAAMSINSGAYNGYIIDAALAESPIPEPPSLGLVCASLLGLGLIRRRA